MEIRTQFLPPEEQAHLKLRALFESYGYGRYRMGKFEPYDMYIENRSFLRGEGIITFTDSAGRLMALKPDVTLSIVKNAASDGAKRKLYYNENVFRIERRGEEYREISQMGVEYIGADSGYGEAEVVAIAVKSLSYISESYTLSISHMGYIGGLFSFLGLKGEERESLILALTQKNSEAVSFAAKRFELSLEKAAALLGVAAIHGELTAALAEAEKYCLCVEMTAAVSELRTLQKTLEAMGITENILLDFSVLNTLDYYNGIVFRGYVRESPRAVLAGGRYDGLLGRFSCAQGAVGFALYLSELDRVFFRPHEYDADILLIYGGAPAERVAGEVERLLREGYSVRAEESLPPGVKAKETIYLRVEDTNA